MKGSWSVLITLSRALKTLIMLTFTCSGGPMSPRCLQCTSQVHFPGLVWGAFFSSRDQFHHPCKTAVVLFSIHDGVFQVLAFLINYIHAIVHLLCVFNSSAGWHMATIVQVIVGSVINYVNARVERTCRLLRPCSKIWATPPFYFCQNVSGHWLIQETVTSDTVPIFRLCFKLV